MWKMRVKTACGWQDVCQSGSQVPYQYSTQDQALKMLSICYPDQVSQYVYLGGEQKVRVVGTTDKEES